MNNKVRIDYALVNAACNGGTFKDNYGGPDKDHESKYPWGFARIRPGKIQLPSGLGWYKSFEISMLLPEQCSFRDHSSLFPESQQKYFAGNFAGIVRDLLNGSVKLMFPGFNIEIPEEAARFLTACKNIDKLYEANDDLINFEEEEE